LQNGIDYRFVILLDYLFVEGLRALPELTDAGFLIEGREQRGQAFDGSRVGRAHHVWIAVIEKGRAVDQQRIRDVAVQLRRGVAEFVIAEKALQLKDTLEIAGRELGAQRMAECVSGSGVDLIVVPGSIDGGEHGEQRFIAVELVIRAAGGNARPTHRRPGDARHRRLRQDWQRGSAQDQQQMWNAAHGNLVGKS